MNGPYNSPQPVSIINTVDFVDDFILSVTNVGISSGGVFALGAPPVQPTLSAGAINGSGAFQFQFSGSVGQAYSILASTNLVDWTVISSGTIATSPVTITDSTATSYTSRFYRVRLP